MQRAIVTATLVTVTLVLGYLLSAPLAVAQANSPCSIDGVLCPDMRMVVPKKLNIQNQMQREILRFTGGFANDGPGIWWMQPKTDVSSPDYFQVFFDCSDPVSHTVDCSCSFTNGCIYPQAGLPACPGVDCVDIPPLVFHTGHNHWHVPDIVEYEVRIARDDGTGGRFGKLLVNNLSEEVGFKFGVCMFDDYKLDCSSANTAERNMWDCEVGPQGVTGRNDSGTTDAPLHVGWVDQYHQSLEGQDIDITGISVGNYYLIATVDPLGHYVELDKTNNTAWTSFRLTRESNGNPKVTEITHSDCDNIGLCGGCTKNG